MTQDRGENGPVGQSVRRVDGAGKTTGETRFFSDLYPPDVLWVRTLRSAPGPSGSVHARIRALDASKAESAPGVVRVITAKDVPGENSFGVQVQDQPVLCEGRVRFHGDAVALVVAESKEAASAALELIDVDYEPLPVLLDPDAALAEDAFSIGEGGNVVKELHVGLGDIETGFAESDVLIENTFDTPRQAAAFIETESGVARMEGGGEGDILVVQSGAQNPFDDRREIARSLGIPVERIRMQASPIGGGFGAKDGISMQIHLALAAWLTGRPVRLFWEREESNLAGWKRHPFRISLKTGVKRDGTLTAHRARVVADTGAYVGCGPAVLCVAVEAVGGPYRIPHVGIDGYCVLTNNTPAGAIRGFGAVQACLAMECQMDALAEALSMDPLALRKRNAVRAGETAPLGNVLKCSVHYEETLAAVESSGAWRTREDWKREVPRPWIKRGVGIASGMKGMGMGQFPDGGSVRMEITAEGKFVLGVGLSEMGEGITTAFVQMAAETLHCPPGDVELLPVDTDQVPECGGADASRSTMTGGNAILRAAPLMEALLKKEAAGKLEVDEEDLELHGGVVRSRSAQDRSVGYAEIGRSIRGRGESGRVEARYEWPRDQDPIPGAEELPHLFYAFATHLARVEVDTLTGRVRLLGLVTAQDVGRVINPQGLEGQSEGGSLYSAGISLWEDTLLSDAGVMLTPNFTTYLIGTAADAPEIETLDVDGFEPLGPFGAKGAGEIVTLPAAAAVVNAIRDAAGVRVRRTPATPERVFRALQEKAAGVS